MAANKSPVNPSQLTRHKKPVELVPIAPPKHASIPSIFDPASPLIPKFLNHESTESEQLAALDEMSNLQLAGLYALWSAPHTSTSAVLQLIKETTNLIKHRCKLYNLPYDSNSKVPGNHRLRTIPLD